MKRLSINMDGIMKMLKKNCDIKLVFGDSTIKAAEAKFLYFIQSKYGVDTEVHPYFATIKKEEIFPGITEDKPGDFTAVSVYSLMKAPIWPGYCLSLLSVVKDGDNSFLEAKLVDFIPDKDFQQQSAVSLYCADEEEHDLLPTWICQIRVKN